MKACETVDNCTEAIVDQAQKSGYAVLIIADHGNAETMKNPDGSSHTAHTTNPVPFYLVDNDVKSLSNGVLGDIAPTILSLMGLDQPEEMTGTSLI